MTKANRDFWLKAIGTVVALIPVVFAAARFLRTQSVEAAKPYLERKLKWCEEAVETTSFIASSEPTAAQPKIAPFPAIVLGSHGHG